MSTAAGSRSAGGAVRPPMWVIFAITVTGITTNTLITPSLPEIVTGVGAARAQAGLLLGASSLPGIVLAPVIGVLADRFGRREILIPCLVAFAVAGGLVLVATSLPQLLVLRFVQGCGSAGLINLAVVLIGDHWEGPDRARMIGRNAAVLTLCLSVFPALGGVLTDLGGWRAPFALYPLALVTAGLMAWRLPRSEPLEVGLREQLGRAAPVLRQPQVLAAIAAGVIVFALIFGLLLTVLPLYLEAAFGLSAGVRGLLLGLPALSNTAVQLSLGRLQRFTKRQQLSAGALVLAGGTAITAATPLLAPLVVGILCFGAGEGLLLGNLQDIAASAGDGHSRGTVVALFVSGARTGQTVGPVAAGAGLGLLGASVTLALGAAVALGLLLPLILVAYRPRVPRTGPPSPATPPTRDDPRARGR